MARLPDPRQFGSGAGGAIAAAAIRTIETQAGSPQQIAALSAQLAAGDDASICRALRQAPSAQAYRELWQGVCALVEHAPDEVQVLPQLFAIPLIVIAACDRPVTISGVVPDIGAISALLDERAALGPTRNFGLSNALCTLEALEALSPSWLFRFARAENPAALPPQLAPGDIQVERGRERAHLRYIVGAALRSRDAPSIVETASNIGAWGMPLTRALGGQLAQPGLQLLVLPRAPKGMLAAAHEGRFAQLDVALHLFVSNTVRRIRQVAGDPQALLAAHADGELRMTLCAPFDIELVEGFRWPLHPLDDPDEIERRMLALLAECRVNDVQVIETVLPALDRNGGVLFARPAGFERSDLKH